VARDPSEPIISKPDTPNRPCLHHLFNQGQERPGRPARDPPGARGASWRILKPGHNCWRVAEARRAAVLVDAADYYRHLHGPVPGAALDHHPGVGFRRPGSSCARIAGRTKPAARSPSCAPWSRTRPELEIRILVWSVAVVHAPGDSMALLLGDAWQEHPRIHLHLDTKHPFYASHHQKVVVIDDSIAFAGGIDLTISAGTPHRTRPRTPAASRRRGRPTSRCTTCRWRWRATPPRPSASLPGGAGRWRGETPPVDRAGAGGWPDELEPDFTDVPVAISRTAPGWGGTGRRSGNRPT
jgi:hypothetical protein